MLEFILVGRTPLGSAIRASVLGVVVTIFWRLFLSPIWQWFLVSLVTVLIAVFVTHWFSRRDDAWKSGKSNNSEPGNSPSDTFDG